MVLWKGIDLRDKGIIVEYTPKISKAKKKIDVYEIEGRNGFVSIDTGSYEPFSMPVECHISDRANKDEICEFLDGYGTLSLDGIRQYTAIINNAIEFEKILKFKKFLINFLVNPIAEDIESTNINIDSNNYVLNINDTYSSIFPILKITCSGDVTFVINNKTFILKGTSDTYTLDCKNKVITDSLGNNASSIMLYDFPSLQKGENNISYIGEVSNFEIEYKRTYL